jgi:hypothetical protein
LGFVLEPERQMRRLRFFTELPEDFEFNSKPPAFANASAFAKSYGVTSGL